MEERKTRSEQFIEAMRHVSDERQAEVMERLEESLNETIAEEEYIEGLLTQAGGQLRRDVKALLEERIFGVAL